MRGKAVSTARVRLPASTDDSKVVMRVGAKPERVLSYLRVEPTMHNQQRESVALNVEVEAHGSLPLQPAEETPTTSQ
jgi:hypothetical protein